MPSVFDVLLANGVEPTGFLSDRLEGRGDIFRPYTPYGDRVHYGDFTDRDHWRRVGEQMADFDLLVLNTMAYNGPANLALDTGLPTIGVVHNPPMMLNNPINVELIRSGQCTPASLAPHVTSWMLAREPHLLANTVTLGAWMWRMPRADATARADRRRRIAVPGAVDFAKRDFPAIVEALPGLLAEHGRDRFVVSVVGGGRDREALEQLVHEHGLGDIFDFAPVDEPGGHVSSHDFYAGLASADVLLPHLPTAQTSYRTFKISAALSCSVGFEIPAVLDRWTAATYRVPCRTYPVGDVVAGLTRALELDDDDLAGLRADLAVERAATIERASAEMATALSTIGSAPPSVVADPHGLAVDPDTIQRDDREAFLAFCAAVLPMTYAQRVQDLWALWESGFSTDAYFCEFGALGGRDFSNTYLLEQVGWTGVVAEPHPSYTKALYANRRCAISTECVYDKTGETVEFHTIKGRPALSTIGGFGADDHHREVRENYVSHQIATITLHDLFEEAGAPAVVDYLSIDTEGSEVAILRAYDFAARSIRLICVEHNEVHRDELFEMLTAQGYERKWPDLSGHDDWYVLRGSYPHWSARGLAPLVSRVDVVEPFERDFDVRAQLMRTLRTDPQDPRAQLGLPPRPERPAQAPADDRASRAVAAHYHRQLLEELAKAGGVKARQVNDRTRRLFYRMTRRISPSVVLEVGAFEGHFSAQMRAALPDASVIAFEANPHVHDRFRDELTALGVDYRHRAVANRPGKVEVHVPRRQWGSALQPVNQMAGLRPRVDTGQHEVVRVPTVRLDDLVDPDGDDRVVAWISAGGACREVFEGMEQTLGRTLALFVQVEADPVWEDQWLEADVEAHLAARGFVLVGADRMRGTKERGLVFVHGRLARRRWVARMAADVVKPSARTAGALAPTPDRSVEVPVPRTPAERAARKARALARRARRDAARVVGEVRKR
ncbi:FkbM family methyltransferase [Nocardioides sp. C4-1]|uniref:FkbM family methyltransferase n=1 Tax=Nocardioides sp. C4-1 TaxID=3151851 RepID=UPI003267CEC6